MNDLEDVLYKYFRDEKILYYRTADAMANGQYIKWKYLQNQRQKIVMIVGSNEGEVEVKSFTESKELDSFIKLVIY